MPPKRKLVAISRSGLEAASFPSQADLASHQFSKKTSHDGGPNVGCTGSIEATKKQQPSPTHQHFATRFIHKLNDLAQVKQAYPSWVQKASLLAFESLTRYAGRAFTWSLAKLAKCIYNSYHVDQAEFDRIAALEQRSEEWTKLRKGWIDVSDPDNPIIRAALVSSSTCGEILGHKQGYKDDRSKVVREQAWATVKKFDDFAMSALQRGTASEPMIMNLIKLKLQSIVRQKMPRAIVNIKEVGLQVCRDHPYQAASPDGKIEIYDPDTQTLIVGGLEMKCRAGINHDPYPVIKPEYYDQIQHTMAVLGLDQYVFVCLSNSNFSIEFFNFDARTWERNVCFIQEYYWKRLWPALWMKAHNMLVTPDVSLIPSISTVCADTLDWFKTSGLDVKADPIAAQLLETEDARASSIDYLHSVP